MIIALLLAAAVQADGLDEVPFRPVSSYETAEQCRTHLTQILKDARGYEAARGPYAVSDDDIRIHLVRAEGDGHVITEHRCRGAAHETRGWRHTMNGVQEEAETLES